MQQQSSQAGYRRLRRGRIVHRLVRKKKRKKNRSSDIFDFILVAERGEKGHIVGSRRRNLVYFLSILLLHRKLAIRLTSQLHISFPYSAVYYFESRRTTKTKGNIVVLDQIYSYGYRGTYLAGHHQLHRMYTSVYIRVYNSHGAGNMDW